MLNLIALTHATMLPAASAATDVWQLVPWLIGLTPAALILLWVAVAWFFLTDQPRQRFR